jgi:hypothetical protein
MSANWRGFERSDLCRWLCPGMKMQRHERQQARKTYLHKIHDRLLGRPGGAVRANPLAADEGDRPVCFLLVQRFACGMSQPLDLVLNH